MKSLIFVFLLFFIHSPFMSLAFEINGIRRTDCKECHQEITKEWEDSMHSKAWTSELFTREVNEERKLKNFFLRPIAPDCRNCHAPENITKLEKLEKPKYRKTDQSLGVDCITCHYDGKRLNGPFEVENADCGAVKSEFFLQQERDKICSQCHEDEYKEWKGTKYEREGEGCVSCHMPETERPLVEGGKRFKGKLIHLSKPRKVRKHTFVGGHDTKLMKESLTVKMEIQKDRGKIILTNDKTGHNIPSNKHGHRRLILTVNFVNNIDQTVKRIQKIWGTDPNPLARVSGIKPMEIIEISFKLDPSIVRIKAFLGYKLAPDLSKKDDLIIWKGEKEI